MLELIDLNPCIGQLKIHSTAWDSTLNRRWAKLQRKIGFLLEWSEDKHATLFHLKIVNRAWQHFINNLQVFCKQQKTLYHHLLFTDYENYLYLHIDRLLEKIPPSQKAEQTCLDLCGFIKNSGELLKKNDASIYKQIGHMMEATRKKTIMPEEYIRKQKTKNQSTTNKRPEESDNSQELTSIGRKEIGNAVLSERLEEQCRQFEILLKKGNNVDTNAKEPEEEIVLVEIASPVNLQDTTSNLFEL